jgi:N-acetyl-alpha-D-glucosaminyl L-malate synthase BshA
MANLIASVTPTVQLDVLHFHYALPFASILDSVRAALGPACPPIIGTLHGTDVSVHALDPFRGPMLIRTLGTLDAISTVSRAHATLAKENLGLEPCVIPNFVDLHRFKPRARVGCRTRIRVAHASNFRAVKDPVLAARIFVGIREEIDAELWLIGDGEEMAPTRRHLERHAVMDHVREFGLRSDVETLLPEVDVLLVTSRSESFCLTALEAAACAVPVVATAVGGLPEVVDDGKTGLLFDPDVPVLGVEAVLRVLRDPSLRMDMGRAAEVRARDFAADVIVPRYESLYSDVIAGTYGPASSQAPDLAVGEVVG